jgi:hypothetical protein
MSEPINYPRATTFACGPQCVDGTEEHKWDGPTIKLDNGASVSCSRCGRAMIDVCLWWDDGLSPPLSGAGDADTQ